MAAQEDINLGERDLLRGAIFGALSAAEKVVRAPLQGHGWGSVGEAVEMGTLGGLTSGLWPYVTRGVNRIYRNSIEAARDPDITLGQLTGNIWVRLLQTFPAGYLTETLYSLYSTQPVNSVYEYFNHMAVHAVRGAVEGVIASVVVPLTVYGIKRGLNSIGIG